MTSPVIEFESVAKAFRRGVLGDFVPALTSVSFQVVAGEVCAFLGPNGAGKTTSIGILMGFMWADFGNVRVLGHSPGDIRAKQRIGFLPENFAFHKHLNAEELLRYHWKLAGSGNGNGGDPDELIFRLLSQVKLTAYSDLKIGKYSRGMMQRLGLAQALLAGPELLVLDEPTSGLDPAGRKEVRDLILALKAEGKTVFLSSHILAEVEQICDRAIFIDGGRVIRAGTMEELLAGAGRVEIVVDQLPETVELALRERIAALESIERDAHGVRITLAPEAKREAAELLWSEGCDVMSINTLRNSLEGLFLELVKK